MPLARSLTRRLKKINRSVSSVRLNKLYNNSSSTATLPLDNTENFISIPFDNVDVDDAEDTDTCSLTSSTSNHESLSGEPATPNQTNLSNYSATTTPATSTSSMTGSSYFPATTTNTAATSAVGLGCGISLNESSGCTSPIITSRDPHPNNRDTLHGDSTSIKSVSTTQSASHKPAVSVSSSCYTGLENGSPFIPDEPYFVNHDNISLRSQPAISEVSELSAKDIEDAKADEMAMRILEKVSAHDYVQEIRGSWCIS